MTRRVLHVVAALSASLTLTGCTKYASPKLSIAEVKPTERTNEGAAMLFVINAENDNDVALPLRTVNYALELNGRRVFDGTRSAEATLRRRGVQQFSLPAVVNLADAGTSELVSGRVQYRLTGELNYLTPGQITEILFDAGLRKPTESFAFEGEVDMSTVAPPAMVTPAPAPQASSPAAPPAATPAEPANP